jgi:S-adenosylmethionine-diacylglycerol 3-amino-3-carboxypropyl transferase
VRSEAAAHADFSEVRYAQVWEDADVLLEGLAVRPGDVCVSIASAGDNALALLTKDPARVIAIDLSPAQLCCLALRVAAYRTLTHGELLELVGSRPSTRRIDLFERCRPSLDAASRCSGIPAGPRSTQESEVPGSSSGTSRCSGAACCRSCTGARPFAR